MKKHLSYKITSLLLQFV